jgi:DNA-binding transcriptional regulator PaaX
MAGLKKQEFKELEFLKETLKKCLCSDELDLTLFYLEQYPKLLNECKRLEEYETAYEYLLEYWESLNKEQHKEINSHLNKVFVINTQEQIKD